MLVITSEQVIIKFDGVEDVAITVPDKYKTVEGGNHRLSGLCGNLDGSPNNDLVDFTGAKRKGIYEFSKVYLKGDECVENLSVTSLFYNPYNNTERVFANAESSCDIINSEAFKPCHGVVDPDQYKLVCMQDVVNCNHNVRSDCMCSAISLYARVCQKKGVNLHWRTDALCRK